MILLQLLQLHYSHFLLQNPISGFGSRRRLALHAGYQSTIFVQCRPFYTEIL